jgi:hypothetical protein
MYADLNNENQEIITGNDSIVVRNVLETIRGGRTLDVTGFTPNVIKAGHVIIKETATGNLKPMPVNSGATAYAALPENHTYEGINISSVLTKKPFAGIMIRGSVNPAAAPLPMTSILSAVKTALPLITFRED